MEKEDKESAQIAHAIKLGAQVIVMWSGFFVPIPLVGFLPICATLRGNRYKE